MEWYVYFLPGIVVSHQPPDCVLSAAYQGTYCVGEEGIEKCSKCTGFKSQNQIKQICDYESECLVHTNNARFFMESLRGRLHGYCTGVEANMKVEYKCLEIPDRHFTCVFGRGLGEGRIRLNRQRGEKCVETCWRKKFADPLITGVTMPTHRGNKDCYCVRNTVKKDTNNYHFKTCFFKYEGSPPPALPPYGVANYNTSSYRCLGHLPGCCTVEQPCDVYDGVCVNDDQCKGRLKCGPPNNCAVGVNKRCCEKRSYENLDASSHYMNLPPQTMDVLGEFKFMCTRNNDFTNRSQKGKIKVQPKKQE